MKNKVTVSAPGKLMLLGEHAVVYNHPCLVTAVNQRMRVTVELLQKSEFYLDAPDVKVVNYKKAIKDLGVGDIPKGAKFVEIAVKNFIEEYGFKKGIKIITESEFSSEFGFGSSSAATVCVIKALSELFEKNLSKKQIFDLAYKTVLDIQGKGSGFDVAAAVYGGTLYFHTGGKIIEPLKINNLPLIVGYSGVKADTVTLMNKVKEKFMDKKQELDKIYKNIEVLVEKAKQRLITEDFKFFGNLMNENQKYLVELGVSIDKLDSMINSALQNGAYGAKLSGAGGGDCIIAIAPESKVTVIKNAITNAGGKIVDVNTNAEGVRVENNLYKKATAIAPSNIAFIKYWGRKKDPKLRLPENGSISMNLSNLLTTTTVEFNDSFKEDEIIFNGKKEDAAGNRAILHLDRIRDLAKIKTKAKVVTENNFPTGTGLSSSASGFAALTLAASNAAGLNLSEKELSILARQGSGSACRSIPDGFVEWLDGDTSETSYSKSLYPLDYWDIVDVVAVTSMQKKDVSSSIGHTLAGSSPFFSVRKQNMKEKIKLCKKYLKEKNFQKLGELIEAEALELHAIYLTSNPSLLYLLPSTLRVMHAVKKWRTEDLPVYFTLNTGQDIHLICEKNNAKKVAKLAEGIEEVQKTIINYPSVGARLSEKHLF